MSNSTCVDIAGSNGYRCSFAICGTRLGGDTRRLRNIALGRRVYRVVVPKSVHQNVRLSLIGDTYLTLTRNLELTVGILQLLHYIVFKMESQLDLQRVIQFPPHRFNGLEHMFVVGLGRLSYADPPEWNDNTCKLLSETCAGSKLPKSVALSHRLSELARDLLEHIIDGPEVDTIWGMV